MRRIIASFSGQITGIATEGPTVIHRNNRIFLTFSASAAFTTISSTGQYEPLAVSEEWSTPA